MNDRIKQLLATAEKVDGLANIKWRIANREQLRKERKEKLKELIEKDKNYEQNTRTNYRRFFGY